MTSTTPTPSAPAAATPTRTLGIISVVTAAASIVLGHTFLLPIAAIIVGFIARSREPESRLLSTIGIIGGFVILFGWVLVAVLAGSILIPLAVLHGLHW